MCIRDSTNAVHRSKRPVGPYKKLEGIELIDKVIDIDQSPIGRTPRSNPATYIGLWDDLRALYASTPESRMRGYGPGRFSFNVPGGRCEACKGDGPVSYTHLSACRASCSSTRSRSPARSTATPWTTCSRATSRSTLRTAPAPTATCLLYTSRSRPCG